MGRVRNLAIALVLLAGLGYLGVKGYIHYQVTSALDRTIAKAGPFAVVEYGGVSSSLSGSVSVEDVTVRAFNDEVRMAAVELHTPNLLYVLSMVSDLEQGEPPESLEVRVRDVSLDLNGSLMSFLDSALRAKAPRLPARNNPCGGRVVFGPAQWREMGYSRLVSDLRMRVDTDDSEAGLGFAVQATTEDMGSLSVDVRVSGVQPSLRGAPRAQDALLKRLEVVYRDASYTRRLVEYCARVADTDAEGYVRSVVGADDRYFMHTWGVVPGENLRAAYGRFLREPSEIRVLAQPDSPVQLATLHLYSPDDMVALLDLQVAVNGEPVDQPRFTMRPELLTPGAGAPALSALPGMGSAPSVSASPRPAPAVKNEPRTLAFRAVDKNTLGRYVGRTVRIMTARNQEREGILMATDEDRVVLERRMYGGSMSVPVPLREIERVEVLLP